MINSTSQQTPPFSACATGTPEKSSPLGCLDFANSKKELAVGVHLILNLRCRKYVRVGLLIRLGLSYQEVFDLFPEVKKVEVIIKRNGEYITNGHPYAIIADRIQHILAIKRSDIPDEDKVEQLQKIDPDFFQNTITGNLLGFTKSRVAKLKTISNKKHRLRVAKQEIEKYKNQIEHILASEELRTHQVYQLKKIGLSIDQIAVALDTDPKNASQLLYHFHKISKAAPRPTIDFFKKEIAAILQTNEPAEVKIDQFRKLNKIFTYAIIGKLLKIPTRKVTHLHHEMIGRPPKLKSSKKNYHNHEFQSYFNPITDTRIPVTS